MTLIDVFGLLAAFGFFMVWLDMRASSRIISIMRKDISILHSRIVVLERGQKKSD